MASFAPGLGSPPHGPAFCGSPRSLVFSHDGGVSSLKCALVLVLVARAVAITKANLNEFFTVRPSGNGFDCDHDMLSSSSESARGRSAVRWPGAPLQAASCPCPRRTKRFAHPAAGQRVVFRVA